MLTVSKVNGMIWSSWIDYNPDYVKTLSEKGEMICLLHEYIHATLAYENKSYEDHNVLVNDPDWMQGIKEIFPGQTSDFYDKMKYAGCDDINNNNEIKQFINAQIKK